MELAHEKYDIMKQWVKVATGVETDGIEAGCTHRGDYQTN